MNNRTPATGPYRSPSAFSLHFVSALLLTTSMAACSPNNAPGDPPNQAGQPLNPVETVSKIATINAAAALGNPAVAQEQFTELHADMMRSMRMQDVTRRVDPEAARAIVLKMRGVRGAAWVDTQNLLVRVSGPEFKSYSILNEICSRLDPLGDTLGVTVNLQDVTATSGDAVNTLRRNCQLRPGEHAFAEMPRDMDVIDPELRARHAQNNARMRSGDVKSAKDYSKGDQAAIDAIPEM